MKNQSQEKPKRKINWKIVIYSIIGLTSLVLTFVVNWLFIIIAAIMMWLNQRELIKNRKK